MIIVDDYKKVWGTMLHPGETTGAKMDVGQSITYYFKGTAIPFIITLLEIALLSSLVIGSLSLIIGKSVPALGTLGALFVGVIAVIYLVYWLVLTPIQMLIYACVLHVLGKFLLKFFNGTFEATFAGIAYGTAAGYSLSWIPFVSIIGWVWGFIVTLIAVGKQNGTSALKVFAVTLIPIVIVGALVAVSLVSLMSLGGGGNSLGSVCLANSGFMCQHPVLQGSTLTVRLGQVTGQDWESTNLIWMPSGTSSPPPLGESCPAIGSNSTSYGLSCAEPQGVSMQNGQVVNATFTFGSPASPGSSYVGQIWAVYQTNAGGAWHETEMSTVSIKAV